MKKVSVSDYRGAIDSLNGLENKYHACVGIEERYYWIETADRRLGEHLDIECARAKGEDRIEFEKAANRVISRIERTVDKMVEELEENEYKSASPEVDLFTLLEGVKEKLADHKSGLQAHMANAMKKAKGQDVGMSM